MKTISTQQAGRKMLFVVHFQQGKEARCRRKAGSSPRHERGCRSSAEPRTPGLGNASSILGAPSQTGTAPAANLSSGRAKATILQKMLLFSLHHLESPGNATFSVPVNY